jgi:hypothetical protein
MTSIDAQYSQCCRSLVEESAANIPPTGRLKLHPLMEWYFLSTKTILHENGTPQKNYHLGTVTYNISLT